MTKSSDKIRIVELFAGVGGFRVGLEKAHPERFETVWFNQWEPGKKEQSQYAHQVYQKHWENTRHLPFTNTDIDSVVQNHIDDLGQALDHDLLVGGFPCQDYSVARPLRQSTGLIGKKGVLWWSIVSLVKQLQEHPERTAPKYLLLENVDRLLKSPGTQRGRDFAIMLRSLETLGYNVEWRVVNAAEYGFPQRRRRIFIVAYRKDTSIAQKMVAKGHVEWLNNGLHGQSFPIEKIADASYVNEVILSGDEKQLSDSFGLGDKVSQFQNAGVMIDGIVKTVKSVPKQKKAKTLKDIILSDEDVIKKFGENYFIDDPITQEKWEIQKGPKKKERINKFTGEPYTFSEGGMSFPDDINKPARTIITGEGGSAASRFKHVVQYPGSERLRRLTPVELEVISMFKPNHTKYGFYDGKEVEMSPNTRAFFIGNALVTGVVTKLGKQLIDMIDE